VRTPVGFFLLRLFLDRPPPRGRDHDLANLDRRVAGHDHLPAAPLQPYAAYD
jgi:hypothetical protein